MFTQLTDNVAIYASQGDCIKYCIVVDDLTVGFADTYGEAKEILDDFAKQLAKDTKKEIENVRVYVSKDDEKRDKLYIRYSSLSYLSLGTTVTKHVLYIAPAPRCIVRIKMPSPREDTTVQHVNLIDRIRRTIVKRL